MDCDASVVQQGCPLSLKRLTSAPMSRSSFSEATDVIHSGLESYERTYQRLPVLFQLPAVRAMALTFVTVCS